jgi:competence protein ComEC
MMAGWIWSIVIVWELCYLRKSRSLAWRGLVLFFVMALIPGYLRGSAERTVWVREQQMELDGARMTYTGTIERLRDRGERWEIVLFREKDAEDVESVEETQMFREAQNPVDMRGKTLRRLLIYVDKTAVEYIDRSSGREMSSAAVRPRIGSRVTAEGKMQSFDAARNPGQFDYRSYYRAQKLSYRMSAEVCRVDAAARIGWSARLRDRLWRLAERAGEILDAVAEPQDAGIFKAAILGDRSGLDDTIRDLYQKNGIAHLLAISALHLSLISMAVYSGLRRLGFRFGAAGLLGGIFLTGFAMMTGMSPSIVRALVMALCGYLAAYCGRTYDLLSALGLSACIILWDSPYQLTQSGVQLSFAAVLGIAAVAPVLRERGLSPAMSVSIGMQLSSLPIVLYHYFQVPLYGIFLNLIVVPLMGLVIASGAAGILLGSRSLAAGRFAVGSGHFVLRLYEYLCTLWLKFPGSNVILGRPEAWQLGVYYGVLVFWLTGPAGCMEKEEYKEKEENKKKKECKENKEKKREKDNPEKQWKNIIPVVFLLILLLPQPPRGLQITVLDVGQGDGICLRTRAGTILVDGGSSSEKTLGEDCLEPYLKSQAVRIIDYAIVSHGDQDHVNGLQYLLEESEDIRIRNLILPAAGRGDAAYETLTACAAARGTTIHWMRAGDTLTSGNLTLSCLYPDSAVQTSDGIWKPRSEERNEHSLVLRADYGSFRMLLTGDMSAQGEQELMEQTLSPVPEKSASSADFSNITILKVAHHGSRYSTTTEFLQTLRPRLAIISCAEKNTYGHPSPETLDRLQQAGVPYRITMDEGAIRITSDGKQYAVRTQKELYKEEF